MGDLGLRLLPVLAGVGTLARSTSAWWRRRAGAAELLVAGEADDALRVSAAALRRLGARITRYDVEERTLEARTAPGAAPLVRVRAAPDGERATRLRIESDARDARRLIRRFRAELTRGA